MSMLKHSHSDKDLILIAFIALKLFSVYHLRGHPVFRNPVSAPAGVKLR